MRYSHRQAPPFGELNLELFVQGTMEDQDQAVIQSAFEEANPHQSPTKSVKLRYAAPKKVCGRNADMQLAVKFKPFKFVRCPILVFGSTALSL